MAAPARSFAAAAAYFDAGDVPPEMMEVLRSMAPDTAQKVTGMVQRRASGGAVQPGDQQLLAEMMAAADKSPSLGGDIPAKPVIAKREPQMNSGLTQVKGLSNAERFGFFQAAAEFFEAAPWKLLIQTKCRQFSCSWSSHANTVDNASERQPRLFDLVELFGLTSAAGKKLNGLQGELVPPQPSADIAVARWPVRLLDNGRIVKAKPENTKLIAAAEDTFVVKVSGADNGEPGLLVYKSWAACWQHNEQTHVHGDFPPSDNGLFMMAVSFVDFNKFPHMKPMSEADDAMRRRLSAPLAKRSVTGFSSTSRPSQKSSLHRS